MKKKTFKRTDKLFNSRFIFNQTVFLFTNIIVYSSLHFNQKTRRFSDPGQLSLLGPLSFLIVNKAALTR